MFQGGDGGSKLPWESSILSASAKLRGSMSRVKDLGSGLKMEQMAYDDCHRRYHAIVPLNRTKSLIPALNQCRGVAHAEYATQDRFAVDIQKGLAFEWSDIEESIVDQLRAEDERLDI